MRTKPDYSTTMKVGELQTSKGLVALVVKNLPANAGDVIEAGSIPGLGRSPGGRHGNPLQYSCLENPMDRGAWRVRVHRVTKSSTRLKRLSMNAHTGFKKEEARIHNNV